VIAHAPFLSRSGLTGRWWLVTKYTEDAKGNRVASVKYEMDEAIERIRSEAKAEALREFRALIGSPLRDDYPLRDAECDSPTMTAVRQLLDVEANRIEAGL